MSKWSYNNNTKWGLTYPMCSLKNNNNQSPVDISPNDILQDCNVKCEITIKYKPSKCFITNENNTITINYDAGSYIIYQNNWYELTYAKLHIPSLHTYNGQHLSAEIDLYHCSDRQCDSGIVLAILLDRGNDYGESVNFLNQFIFQAPIDNTQVEREISVSNDWNIVSLIPTERTCYVYNGSLPHPPCNDGWTWIVFNQPSKIGMTALKSLQKNLVSKMGQNIRPPFKITEDRSIYRVSHDSVKVFEERPLPDNIVKVDDPNFEEPEQKVEIPRDGFLSKYRSRIRNLMLFWMVVLLIYLSIKITKYLIKNDIINNFLMGKSNKQNQGNQSINNNNFGNNNFNNIDNLGNNNLNK